MRVHFLATHFRNTSEVREFIKMLAAMPRPAHCRLSLSITDNSHDLQIPEDELPEWATVHDPPDNLGYLNGCDHALAQGIQNPADADFVIVANTDVTLDTSFLYKLGVCSPEDCIAVLAPDVRLPDGSSQNPFLRHRPPPWRLRFYRLLFHSGAGLQLLDLMAVGTLWFTRLLRRHPESTESGEKRSQIYAAHGSLFVLRPIFFESGGKLAYGGFLYGEEIHIAEQVRQLHLQVQFVPGLRVLHQAHTVTGRSNAGQRARYKRESLSFLLNNHFSDNPRITEPDSQNRLGKESAPL